MTRQAVSVVTGAAHGIGRASAERLAYRGDLVYALDLDPAGSDLAGCRFLPCDVTSPDQVSAAAHEIEASEGRVDVLVNNAGGFPAPRRVDELTLDEWNRTLELNLTSSFLVTQTFLPLLRRANGARVVNIGSLAGQTSGWPTSPAYAAAKGAVHALTRALAYELAGEGITVNALSPSAVATERIRQIRSEAEMEETARRIPLGRYQEPAELAAWVDFLTTEEAGFMTGETVSVNGGRFMS